MMNTTPPAKHVTELDLKTNDSLKVREYVVENFFHGDDSAVHENTSFFEEGNVHSWSILDLVKFLERTYNINIQNDEILPKNLDNLENITRFINQKLSHYQNLYYY